MNKNDIVKTINEVKTNNHIKWSVLENTDTKIVLTNDYDKCINFSIEVRHREIEWGDTTKVEEWIAVKDNHMGSNIALLLQGDTRWDDYKETTQGIIMGIRYAVQHFEYMY